MPQIKAWMKPDDNTTETFVIGDTCAEPGYLPLVLLSEHEEVLNQMRLANKGLQERVDELYKQLPPDTRPVTQEGDNVYAPIVE